MLHTTYVGYRKIPKISPRAFFFQRPFLRGLSTKGNLRFKIAWACLIVEFEGNFPGGAFICRGLFLEFYGITV